MRMTIKRQLYYCDLIVRHVKRLGPDLRRWLMRRLTEVECADVCTDPDCDGNAATHWKYNHGRKAG